MARSPDLREIRMPDVISLRTDPHVHQDGVILEPDIGIRTIHVPGISHDCSFTLSLIHEAEFTVEHGSAQVAGVVDERN